MCTPGKQIVFPMGDASFADEVAAFQPGTPPARDKRWADPGTTLGPPDFDAKRVTPADPRDVVLGCTGTLVVRFTDNDVVDAAGPDLYVFEVGPAVEAMHLAISKDGESWTDVGKIAGGTAEIDISSVAAPGERFSYVRVTDLKSACGGPYPGADIDAIGAIGAAVSVSIDASVLFGFDKSTLLPQAQSALADAAAKIASFSDAGTFLQSRPELKGREIAASGLGASRPAAEDTTEEGRQANRRVEIVISSGER